MKVMRINLHICISLHLYSFLCIAWHFSALRCISLHFSAFQWISRHFSIWAYRRPMDTNIVKSKLRIRLMWEVYAETKWETKILPYQQNISQIENCHQAFFDSCKCSKLHIPMFVVMTMALLTKQGSDCWKKVSFGHITSLPMIVLPLPHPSLQKLADVFQLLYFLSHINSMILSRPLLSLFGKSSLVAWKFSTIKVISGRSLISLCWKPQSSEMYYLAANLVSHFWMSQVLFLVFLRSWSFSGLGLPQVLVYLAANLVSHFWMSQVLVLVSLSMYYQSVRSTTAINLDERQKREELSQGKSGFFALDDNLRNKL